LPLNWSSIETLKSYIMDDDGLHLQKNINDKSVNFDYSTFLTECRVSDLQSGTLIENAYGGAAHELCSIYYD